MVVLHNHAVVDADLSLLKPSLLVLWVKAKRLEPVNAKLTACALNWVAQPRVVLTEGALLEV